VAFYLLVLPGVTLHEAAHYLACLLTGTRVLRFVPFWPQRSARGRLLLGYVLHERRPFPVKAVIGLAPILLNPLGILLATALLTPLTLAEVTDPQFEVIKEGILTSGFLTGSPLVAATWIYLSLSFALGSVPSREDLSSVPAALLFFGGGVLGLPEHLNRSTPRPFRTRSPCVLPTGDGRRRCCCNDRCLGPDEQILSQSKVRTSRRSVCLPFREPSHFAVVVATPPAYLPIYGVPLFPAVY
jgi:hypothetical protein